LERKHEKIIEDDPNSGRQIGICLSKKQIQIGRQIDNFGIGFDAVINVKLIKLKLITASMQH
jgi:hypothetical protein